MPSPTQDSTETAVARASGPVRTMARRPVPRSASSAVRGRSRAPGRPRDEGGPGSAQATGTARQISARDSDTAALAPASAATVPASAGPSSAAPSKVIASSAFARARPPRGPASATTRGSCEVHPPAIAAPAAPPPTAIETVPANGSRPSAARTRARAAA
ncbi:hypothetical protein [Streptacidiphilus sp. P02-A3a]|uniref:hypothetical protein n=1 Tax=Streptacidiphilus sp. P02-A3a TaxID=2704468 RepID=UPI00351A79AB